MNVKLHTPKSLKSGSGMGSMKQFMLSIFATTVSIALTFGTAAIIDGKKKEKEKREIVMMVMYDMYNSLKWAEQSDSLIQKSLDVQISIAEDTSLYESSKYQMGMLVPIANYTETTERIFSSNIESINTVGNVLFTESVAKFYRTRQLYKSMVTDSISQELSRLPILQSLGNLLKMEYYYYALISNDYLYDMRSMYESCKQIMKVTDGEMEAYRQQRTLMVQELSARKSEKDSLENDLINRQQRLSEAKKKLNIE